MSFLFHCIFFYLHCCVLNLLYAIACYTRKLPVCNAMWQICKNCTLSYAYIKYIFKYKCIIFKKKTCAQWRLCTRVVSLSLSLSVCLCAFMYVVCIRAVVKVEFHCAKFLWPWQLSGIFIKTNANHSIRSINHTQTNKQTNRENIAAKRKILANSVNRL